MSVQLSVAVRNARLDAIEAAVGTSPLLKIVTGTLPANCAAADGGTVLVSITCPSDWASNAASGTKALLGTWQANAIASGVAGHYRLYDSSGTTCHEQGTLTVTSGGGDIELQNLNINVGQSVTITAKSWTDGNA
jgi:hypothetical protein